MRGRVCWCLRNVGLSSLWLHKSAGFRNNDFGVSVSSRVYEVLHVLRQESKNCMPEHTLCIRALLVLLLRSADGLAAGA